MPDTENPQPPADNEPNVHYSQATAIEPDEYQKYADEYLNQIHEKVELVQENREDVEVDYSVRTCATAIC